MPETADSEEAQYREKLASIESNLRNDQAEVDQEVCNLVAKRNEDELKWLKIHRRILAKIEEQRRQQVEELEKELEEKLRTLSARFDAEMRNIIYAGRQRAGYWAERRALLQGNRIRFRRV